MNRKCLTSDDMRIAAFGGNDYLRWLALAYPKWRLCQSQIEPIFAGAFEYVATLNEESAPLVLLPQHRIHKYICDFAVYTVSGERELSGALRGVIECDGHEFHERTKEQASRDRSRDRWFAIQGVPVIRFTGSEIYKSAIGCAFDAIQILDPEWRKIALCVAQSA